MFKNLLYIAILTTVVVGSWVAFSIYHNSATSTIDKDTMIKIDPIIPGFDKETIEKIRAKKIIEADLNKKRINTSVSPTPDQKASTSSELNADIDISPAPSL